MPKGEAVAQERFDSLGFALRATRPRIFWRLKRLIKNRIICWNYLYLSEKFEEIKDTASREAFLDAVAHASAVSGSTSTCSASMTSRTRSCETASEFDPQNWWDKWGAILGVAQSPKIHFIKGDKRNGHVALFGPRFEAKQPGRAESAKKSGSSRLAL